MLYICIYCNQERINPKSLRNHERLCKKNPLKDSTPFQDPEFQKSRRNRSNQFIKAKQLGQDIPVHPQKGKPGKPAAPKSQAALLKLRSLAIERQLGGVRPSKRINYNGKLLGSTYELELAIDLDKHGIKWEIPKRIRYVDPNGKIRSYSPDFFLNDYEVYLDPKNDFLLQNINPRLGFSDVEKIKLVEEQNNIRVLILNKSELTWDIVSKLLAPKA